MITAASPGWWNTATKQEKQLTELAGKSKDGKKDKPESQWPINFATICKDKNNYQIAYVEAEDAPGSTHAKQMC